MSFVCAFRGRRDSYEVPLALAETGRLERFVTDFFQTRGLSIATRVLPSRLREKLSRRSKAGIPLERVECLLGGAVLEALLIRAGRPAAATYMHFDAMYSRAAARIARKHRADLFLYSPYAMPAFGERYEHRPLKVLFQFHPHPRLERLILVADAERWAREGLTFSDRIVSEEPPAAQPDYDQGWVHADHIICASSFTKKSLTDVGAARERISVIPYGVDLPAPVSRTADRSPGFHVLFVGSGIQRKGLHHLLHAWRAAQFRPGEARLTLVSRVIEPGLEALARQVPGVELIPGVSQPELDRLYAAATLFCMPSLVEGFGQVYLEALSHGLPVLGTANTCLPDLGGPGDSVYCVKTGDVDALAGMLRDLSGTLQGDEGRREAARLCATRFTWTAFRRKIMAVVDSLESARTKEEAS
jgi:glycosyltransferase involved in cell wall biosynthesis